jgi:hypothetical protein
MGFVFLLSSSVGQGFVSKTLNEYNSTEDSNIHLRINMLKERYDYLKNNDKLLFGIGPRSDEDYNNAIYFYYGVVTQRGIFTADIGLATLLLCYGIIGSAFYIFIFTYFIINFRKKSGVIVIAAKLQILSSIVSLANSSSLLDYKTVFLSGIMFGLIMSITKIKEKQNYDKSISFNNSSFI